MAQTLASTRFGPAGSNRPQFTTATDLAEELVRQGVPFRTAHERVGSLVLACESSGRGLDQLTQQELDRIGLGSVEAGSLTAAWSVAAKRTLGSTAPAEVAAALREARTVLGQGQTQGS